MTDPNQSNGENDPKKLWQNQPREEMTMTLKLIRQRAQDLRSRTLRGLLGNIAATLIVIAIAWFGFRHTDSVGFRSAFAVSIVWGILGQYFLHRGMWSAMSAERSALMTGVEFYRREIDRRRNLIGRFLQWSVGPAILSIGTLTLLLTGMARRMGKPGATVPFAILGVIWVIAAIVLRSADQKALRSEIAQLNEIEKADRS